MSEKFVLVITSESQRYYWEEPFSKATAEGINLACFDTSIYPTEDCRFSIEMDKNGVVSGQVQAFRYQEKQFSETVIINLSDVSVAWYLRPSDLKRNDMVSQLEQDFSLEEANHAFLSLTEALDVQWINHRRDVHRLDNSKLYQQLLATRAGLKVPATLLSNDAGAFSGCFSGGEECLVKSMGLSQIEAGKPKYIYSNIVPTAEIVAASRSLNCCPIFAQEYIPKLYEYRVVMAKPRCIACRIDSQASEKSKVDWRRYDFDQVEHVEVALPEKLIESLWKFMDLANLNFGMIDLIETDYGEFIFLEVNPSGQWGWLQQIADIDVPAAVSLMLKDTFNS